MGRSTTVTNGSKRRGKAARRRGLAARSALCTTLLALLAVGCGTTGESRDPAGAGDRSAAHTAPLAPAVWDGVARPPFVRVDGGSGATLWVLGTIHLGPSEGWRFSESIDRALATSSHLVMELDLEATDEESVASVLAETVILPPGTTLDEVVSPETAKLLTEQDTRLAAMGLPELARRRYEPWFLAMSLLELAMGDTAWSLERSVEATLLARRGDRPLVALETFEEQLRMLDTLPRTLQDAMLRDTLVRLPATLEELERLVEAWRVADRDALQAIARQGQDELPELAAFYDVLLTARNRRWVARLRPALDDPRRAGDVLFVAVGALHVVGEDGVPRLFEDAGYRVTIHH